MRGPNTTWPITARHYCRGHLQRSHTLHQNFCFLASLLYVNDLDAWNQGSVLPQDSWDTTLVDLEHKILFLHMGWESFVALGAFATASGDDGLPSGHQGGLFPVEPFLTTQRLLSNNILLPLGPLQQSNRPLAVCVLRYVCSAHHPVFLVEEHLDWAPRSYPWCCRLGFSGWRTMSRHL